MVCFSQSHLHLKKVYSIVTLRFFEDHGHLWLGIGFVLIPTGYAFEKVINSELHYISTSKWAGLGIYHCTGTPTKCMCAYVERKIINSHESIFARPRTGCVNSCVMHIVIWNSQSIQHRYVLSAEHSVSNSYAQNPSSSNHLYFYFTKSLHYSRSIGVPRCREPWFLITLPSGTRRSWLGTKVHNNRARSSVSVSTSGLASSLCGWVTQ